MWKQLERMENIPEQLGDKEVDEILLVCGKQQRKRKRKLNHLTPEYKQRLKTTAVTKLLQWMSTGIPESHMKHLVSLSSRLPQMFGLKTKVSIGSLCWRYYIMTTIYLSFTYNNTYGIESSTYVLCFIFFFCDSVICFSRKKSLPKK